jgi:dTDP-4-dehydrorhamnose 3,5-epimerase
MKFIKTDLEGLLIIEPNPFEDKRGWFMRTFSEDIFQSQIHDFSSKWLQMNHSFTKKKHTWRGFHFQLPPFQETKLVRCVRGEVVDIVIDIRKGSQTFLKTYKIELSAVNKKMLYIPKGFAHGFLTLKNNTELIYLHDQYYNSDSECGIRINDPLIKLDLEFSPKHISTRDLNHELLFNKFKGI